MVCEVDRQELTSMILATTNAFLKKSVVPYFAKWDNESFFPKHLFKEMGDLGLLGVMLPQEYGGADLDFYTYSEIVRSIAKIDPSLGLSFAAHNSLPIAHTFKYGNDLQRKQYLPRLTSGESLGAWCLTEPNSGSDASSIALDALAVDGGYLLNGSKQFITHGSSADILVVIARTQKGPTSFFVTRDNPGIQSGRIADKMGMRASETAEVVFSECFIGEEALIGLEGQGLKQALSILDAGRISIAALSLGIAEGAYNIALKYSRERIQFGKPIFEHQAIQFMLAEMATKIHASKLMVLAASRNLDAGNLENKEAAMAKLFASESAVEICNDALQILGGYGLIKEYGIEKFYRDVKLCTIGEGTSEIQKLVISKNLQ